MEVPFNTNINSSITTSPTPIQTQTVVLIMAKLLPSIFIYFMATCISSNLLNSSGLVVILDCSLKQNSSKCSQFSIPMSLSSILQQIPVSLECSSNDLLQFKPMRKRKQRTTKLREEAQVSYIKNYE